jgi:xylulokinase
MLLWETLRPGVGLDTMLAATGMSRTSIEASAVFAPPAVVVTSAMIGQLEEGMVPIELLTLEPASAWSSVLHGYAFVAARAERAMRKLTGVTGPTVLIGGGLRSRPWLEAKRSLALGRVLVSDETEAVSRGAAMFAGVSAGVWDRDRFPAARLREVTHAEPDFSHVGKEV